MNVSYGEGPGPFHYRINLSFPTGHPPAHQQISALADYCVSHWGQPWCDGYWSSRTHDWQLDANFLGFRTKAQALAVMLKFCNLLVD